MYQLYRAADRTSPPAPVIAQAGRTRGLKLIVHPARDFKPREKEAAPCHSAFFSTLNSPVFTSWMRRKRVPSGPLKSTWCSKTDVASWMRNLR